jgi:hypothetical protein
MSTYEGEHIKWVQVLSNFNIQETGRTVQVVKTSEKEKSQREEDIWYVYHVVVGHVPWKVSSTSNYNEKLITEKYLVDLTM